MSIDTTEWPPAYRADLTPRARRPRVALVMAVPAAVVLAVAVAGLMVAKLAAWRFVAFVPLEQPARWLAVISGALVVLAVAAWLGLRSRAAARAVAVGTGVVLVLAPCAAAAAGAGGYFAETDPAGSPARRVAVSPDGGLELVVHDAGMLHYRLRSTGLLSWEGRTDVACTARQGSAVRPGRGSGPSTIPAVLVGAARFTDPAHLELSTSDGRVWTVTVEGVNPARRLDWCGSRTEEPA